MFKQHFISEAIPLTPTLYFLLHQWGHPSAPPSPSYVQGVISTAVAHLELDRARVICMHSVPSMAELTWRSLGPSEKPPHWI